MNRITQKDLEYLVKRINEVTDSPIKSWRETGKGRYKVNIGNYHLDYAYGGIKLVRMYNEGGGISTISTGGYNTKRELYNWMQAFLAGIACNNK
jgi:hypothetical protein